VRGLHTGEALGFPGQTVAGLASLGGCFLVWTGFAMAWRRFRYRKRDADDAPVIKYASSQTEIIVRTETPIQETSKEIEKTEMEQTNANATNGHSHNGYDAARAAWTAAFWNSDPVMILYGTVTGNAEALSNKLARRLQRQGVTTLVRDMAHCQPVILTKAHCVLIVISTYGDGEPPDDAADFYHAIVNGPKLNLSGLEFSVLALGNTTFDHFCRCGKEIDSALERHGATRIYPRFDCDVDYDAPSKRWLSGILARLKQQNDHAALSA
jgi:sulfite reductase (NADPH) flavoprotein alpha-component